VSKTPLREAFSAYEAGTSRLRVTNSIADSTYAIGNFAILRDICLELLVLPIRIC